MSMAIRPLQFLKSFQCLSGTAFGRQFVMSKDGSRAEGVKVLSYAI